MAKSSFSILNADIILTSPGGSQRLVDIRNNIVELRFFESLHKAYVDASLVMLDDFGFRNELSIQGTERIRIVVGNGAIDEDPIIQKTFFFSKINDVQKVNERAEALSIDLVEEHVYVNAIKSVSRSYTERLEDMIIDIANRDLNKLVVKTAYFDQSAQGVRKIIVPFMSPMETMSWLKDRMTTKTGSPIYVHGDLYSNELYMSGLDKLLQEDVVNEKLPLRYGDALMGATGQQELLRDFYEINGFREVDIEDSLALYEEGAIGSFYSNIDAGTGQAYGTHITVRDILQDFYTNGLISDATTQSIFDQSLEIDGRPSDEYNSLHIHQVTSSGTYNQFQSYHDEALLIEGNTLFESRLKIKNKVIRQILKKNTIDIEMGGDLFFERKLGPSRKLRLLFLSPDTNNVKDAAESLDLRKSGDYLLTNVAHTMMEEEHKVSARLIKLGDLPSDFTL